MRQLSGQDSVFLYTEHEGHANHISGLYIYDQSTAPGGVVRFKDLLAHIESRLDASPIFRQKLLRVPLNLDYPYWVDDNDFDLEFHVRHIALPKPGDWRQFCIQVSRLHSRALDLSRPPWEMYVIEGLDNIETLPKGCYALLAKYHHAAVDGMTGVEILSGINDVTPEPVEAREIPKWKPEQAPGIVELMARTSINNIRSPFQLGKAIAATLPGLRHNLTSRQDEGSKSLGVPSTRFNRAISPHRVFEGQPFELAEFKQIKNAVEGATINDVVIAVCSGALRMYLDAKNELPSTPLISVVPISVRTEADPSGNMVSMMKVPMQTQVEDTLKRLREICEVTRAAKEVTNAVGARQLTDINMHIPAATLALAGKAISGLGHRTPKLANCIITNVPGPQFPFYQLGAKMIASYGCGPLIDGLGLIILATSYDGKMFISATSCREIVPDAAFFSDCLKQSFLDLQQATQSSAENDGKKKRRTRTA